MIVYMWLWCCSWSQQENIHTENNKRRNYMLLLGGILLNMLIAMIVVFWPRKRMELPLLLDEEETFSTDNEEMEQRKELITPIDSAELNNLQKNLLLDKLDHNLQTRKNNQIIQAKMNLSTKNIFYDFMIKYSKKYRIILSVSFHPYGHDDWSSNFYLEILGGDLVQKNIPISLNDLCEENLNMENYLVQELGLKQSDITIEKLECNNSNLHVFYKEKQASKKRVITELSDSIKNNLSSNSTYLSEINKMFDSKGILML